MALAAMIQSNQIIWAERSLCYEGDDAMNNSGRDRAYGKDQYLSCSELAPGVCVLMVGLYLLHGGECHMNRHSSPSGGALTRLKRARKKTTT